MAVNSTVAEMGLRVNRPATCFRGDVSTLATLLYYLHGYVVLLIRCPISKPPAHAVWHSPALRPAAVTQICALGLNCTRLFLCFFGEKLLTKSPKCSSFTIVWRAVNPCGSASEIILVKHSGDQRRCWRQMLSLPSHAGLENGLLESQWPQWEKRLDFQVAFGCKEQRGVPQHADLYSKNTYCVDACG